MFVSRFTYFFIFQSVKNRYRAFAKVKTIPFSVSLVLGYIAGLLNTAFITPLERVTTKVMTAHPKEQVTVQAVAGNIWRGGGVSGFYFGWRSTFYNSWCPAVQNAVFDRLRSLLLAFQGKEGRALGWIDSFALGALAKAVSLYATYPIIRSKSMIYNMKPGPGVLAPSILQKLLETQREDGIAGLYQGLPATLVKGVLQSAVMLMVKERLDLAVRTSLGFSPRA